MLGKKNILLQHIKQFPSHMDANRFINDLRSVGTREEVLGLLDQIEKDGVISDLSQMTAIVTAKRLADKIW